MAWIEIHQELRDHPKVKRLAKALGMSNVTARGHIVGLWLWSIQYAPDGDLSGYSAEEIADGADWEKDPNDFVDALVAKKLLDRENGRLLIHDWEEMGLRLLRSMRENKRKSRERHDAEKGPESAPVPVTVTSEDAKVSETVTGQSHDSHVTVSDGGVRPSHPTDLTDHTDLSDLPEKHLVDDAPRRDQAKNLGELRDADFVLRLHDKEFKGWFEAQRRAIANENKCRRNGSPFTWDVHKGMNFESQMRALIYKLSDEEKLRILRESYKILNEKLNWPDYVELSIRYVLVASRKRRVESPFELTMHMLRRPGEIISARSDGLLAGVNMREIGMPAGVSP